MQAPDDYVSHFEEMFAVAYRAAFAVLGDRGDAEDCAQDTLAKALVKWRVVSRHPVPWTARVSTNAAIDRWRKRKRSTLSDDVESHSRDVRTDSAAGAVDGIRHSEQRNDLVRALRTLPRRQREAVVLRHLLDLTEIDTAEALKCSVGTVKSATSRGLDRLRTEFGDAIPASSPTNVSTS